LGGKDGHRCGDHLRDCGDGAERVGLLRLVDQQGDPGGAGEQVGESGPEEYDDG
jgi:hypothetical protein